MTGRLFVFANGDDVRTFPCYRIAGDGDEHRATAHHAVFHEVVADRAGLERHVGRAAAVRARYRICFQQRSLGAGFTITVLAKANGSPSHLMP